MMYILLFFAKQIKVLIKRLEKNPLVRDIAGSKRICLVNLLIEGDSINV